MALIYTEEQQLLRESAGTFLADQASLPQLRSLRDGHSETCFDEAVWQQMAELGWAGIVVPEDYEGLDFGYVGAGIIMEEMGKHLSLSPFFPSALLGATALRLAGSEEQKAALLPAVASGKLLLALAIDEYRHDPKINSLFALPIGDGFELNGHKTYVLGGGVAHQLVVVTRTGSDANDISLFLVDCKQPGVEISPTQLVDGHNAARVSLEAVKVTRAHLIGPLDGGSGLLQDILDVGYACLAAEMLGIAGEAFRRTNIYLKERKQFNLLIGGFQALQHRAAHLFSELELCRSAVLKALQALDEGLPEKSMLASLAKGRCAQLVRLATNEAVQMHGGIGMTDEFDIGFFMKRAQAARVAFGDSNYHSSRFATLNGY